MYHFGLITGMNASEIRQRSKLHEPLPPVPICKDKRVSETSREELSLPEFGGRRSILADLPV